MSLIALCGDTHFRGRDLDNRILVFSKMMQICRDKKVDYVLHGGDLFDKGSVGDKDAPSERIVNEIISTYGHGIPMLLAAGNHDQYGDIGNGLDFIHHSEITKSEAVELHHILPDVDVATIPWLRNDKNYSHTVYNKLNSFKSTAKTRIILGHLNVIGCSIGEDGYVTAESYFSFGLPDLCSVGFDPTHIFLSHIHSRMELNEKARYLGALTQLRYHEDENSKAGFHLFDTDSGVIDFIDLSEWASEYKTIQEEDLEKQLEKDYVRFYTDTPTKYKHLFPRVTAMQRKLAVNHKTKEQEELKSNTLNIDSLIRRFCQVKGFTEPDSDFYLREKAGLSLNFSTNMTGLDFVHSIAIKGVGPHQKEKHYEFKKGFNTITGRNGTGKTMLIESMYAALYENFPSRKNVKHYMGKDSFIETVLTAKGEVYTLRKELANKRFVSYINGSLKELVGQYASAIEPIFGSSGLFSKLVFMDQKGKFDLVEAKSTERLKVLRELFDLEYFDVKLKQYKDLYKEKNEALAIYSRDKEYLKSLQKEYDEMEVPEDFGFNQKELDSLKSKLISLQNEAKLYKQFIYENEQLAWALEFQKKWDVNALRANLNQIQELRGKIKFSNDSKGIGCLSNPLPCVFLKNKVLVDVEETRAKLKALEEDFPEEGLQRFSLWEKKSAKGASTKGRDVAQEELDALQKQITSLEVIKGSSKLRESLVKAKNNLANRIANLAESMAQRNPDELQDDIQSLRFLMELCSKSGLSLYLINIIKLELQDVINELISFTGIPLIINLSTAKKDELDSFDILFGEEQYEVSECSGGEMNLVKILFKLAIMIYLNRSFGNYKVLIMDEPTANCDPENTEIVADIIRKLCKEFEQIIVVTHSDNLANSCDHRIRL